MKRKDIINELKQYFNIKELVCPHTYARFGESSWRFLDDRLLESLLILRRDIFKAPMYINNGSRFTQRGLRCNMCQLVRSKNKAYLSAHILGKAVDFDVKGLSADQARKMIADNIDLFPFPIRIEDDVSWVHFDVIDSLLGKLIFF